MWQSTHVNSGWHSPRREKIWFRESRPFAIVTNEYKWNSSTNKTETSKGQTGKQVFETERDCEELQVFPIRKDSNWTNKGHLNLAHEVLKGAKESRSQDSCREHYRESIEHNNHLMVEAKTLMKNYCTKINLQQINWDVSTTIKSCILFPLQFN